VTTHHPPLAFYSVAAMVIPVLFLAGMVELQYSITARQGMEARESGGPPFVERPLRVALFYVLVVGSLFGEYSVFHALWRGHGAEDDAIATVIALGSQALLCVVALVQRFTSDIGTNPPLEKRANGLQRLLVLTLVALLVVVLVIRSHL
jgi:hypothetical protein